jgi:hypothetical protein
MPSQRKHIVRKKSYLHLPYVPARGPSSPPPGERSPHSRPTRLPRLEGSSHEVPSGAKISPLGGDSRHSVPHHTPRAGVPPHFEDGHPWHKASRARAASALCGRCLLVASPLLIMRSAAPPSGSSITKRGATENVGKPANRWPKSGEQGEMTKK